MSPEDSALEELVLLALRDVIDPEIGLDIVTLGMVYEIEVTNGAAKVTFSLTTPGCPMEHAIRGGIMQSVMVVPGITDVDANLVWEPPWHPGLAEPGVLR